MKINATTAATTPFHVAKAYGIGVAGAPVSGVGAGFITLSASEGRDPRLGRLIAAVVPGGVDFSGDVPTVGRGVLAMYRNPAEKNAAATAVTLGKRVDVSG